jgi:hypothetical protein
MKQVMVMGTSLVVMREVWRTNPEIALVSDEMMALPSGCGIILDK